jgi:hypothetical protein
LLATTRRAEPPDETGGVDPATGAPALPMCAPAGGVGRGDQTGALGPAAGLPDAPERAVAALAVDAPAVAAPAIAAPCPTIIVSRTPMATMPTPIRART